MSNENNNLERRDDADPSDQPNDQELGEDIIDAEFEEVDENVVDAEFEEINEDVSDNQFVQEELLEDKSGSGINWKKIAAWTAIPALGFVAIDKASDMIIPDQNEIAVSAGSDGRSSFSEQFIYSSVGVDKASLTKGDQCYVAGAAYAANEVISLSSDFSNYADLHEEYKGIRDEATEDCKDSLSDNEARYNIDTNGATQISNAGWDYVATRVKFDM